YQRLCPPVSALLSQVGTGGAATMVPDQGRWVEPDVPTAVEHLPAGVDVVAGCGVDGIEPADLCEDHLPERHVAAGHVLGSVIGDQDVDRSTGRARYALRGEAVGGWWQVRSADAPDIGTVEGERQVVRPVGGRVGVAVEV